MSQLTDAAVKAAIEISEHANANGVSFAAGQSEYGVDVEVLQNDEWVYMNDMDEDAEVDAVRFYDCDGNRGLQFETLEELEKVKADWIRAIDEECDR